MNPIPGSVDMIEVLHIDDDAAQLAMMRAILSSFDPNIQLESVSNPKDVLKIIQNRSFDCIVTDFQMPKMNGIELSKKIRQISDIPIILYTGQGSEEVAENAFLAGINDYYRKELEPQHYQVLANKIRNLVENQRIQKIYTSVVEEARDAIGIILNEKIVFANKSFEELTGVNTFRGLIGRSLYSVLGLHKTIYIKELKKIEISENKNTSLEIEIGNRKKTPVEMNLSRINYLGKNGVLCFLRNISKRKKFETSLKQSEVRYRSLLELAPDGIMTINRSGNVTWINTAYTRITGFSEEEIVGKKVWSIDAVRAPDVGMFLKLFLDQIRGKEIPPVEFQWKSKAGKTGWGEGRASLLRVDNVISEVLLITRDITERKALEENLRNYSKEMEALANKRAQKLLESEKMNAAGVVASTVAHDLRGPLSTIRNAVYIMEKNNEQSSDMLSLIKEAVDNSARMLDEVQQNITTENIDVEIVEIKHFIKKILSETPTPPRIKIRTKLIETELLIDQLRIRRVFENLIRNAMEATSRKGTIFIENYIKKGEVVIIIRDTGEGVPKNKINNLFQPFYTTKDKGTGLGLYYCKKTIEAHKGTIRIKSKHGSGTIVEIKIPLPESVQNEPKIVQIVPEIDYTIISQ